MGLKLTSVNPVIEPLVPNRKRKFVDNTTQLADAQTHPALVDTNTLAQNASNGDIAVKNVGPEMERLHRSLHPKYLRHNLWSDHHISPVTADWTESAVPLP
jgi:hypothetical protein